MLSSYIRSLPLWLRYACAFVTGAIIIVALVLFVSHNQAPLSVPAANSNRAQTRQTDEQDRLLLRQEQAPHDARLSAHATILAGASTAVTAFMSSQISRGVVAGPLDGAARCTEAGDSSTRAVVHCNVLIGSVAEDKSLRYPFDVVVSPAKRRVTYCEVMTSPTPGLKSPAISPLCR